MVPVRETKDSVFTVTTSCIYNLTYHEIVTMVVAMLHMYITRCDEKKGEECTVSQN